MFTIDGTQWNIPCDIARMAEMTASDISGLLLDKTYFNDVLGTYMKYTVNLIAVPSKMNDYYAVYEKLSQPINGHTFTFPYNGSTITFNGRVESISDVYVQLPNGARMWKGTQFEIVSNAPTKTP